MKQMKFFKFTVGELETIQNIPWRHDDMTCFVMYTSQV